MFKLSSTTCRSRCGKVATTSSMKRRKLTDVRRSLTCPITRPVATSSAARRACVPLRTYSFVHVRGRRARSGKPDIVLHDKTAKLAEEMGIRRWALSITHTKQHGLAFVIAQDE